MKTKSLALSIIFALFFITAQAATIVRLGPEYFPDPTKGKPVSSGDLYIGVQDLDPEIVANQIQVTAVQESGVSVAISQPISTSAGGVPLYNGSPVTLTVEASYSLKLLDSAGAQVYYVPNSFAQDVSELLFLSNYDCGLAAAISDIGATETTLTVDCDAIIASGTTVTIPSTLSLNIVKGGSIDGVAGGGTETLNINGPLMAGVYQVFGVNLTVSGQPLVAEFIPEWWGNDTTPGTTDMSYEIQQAINLTTANTRIPINFTNIEYYIGTTALTIPVNGVYFKGNGAVVSYAGADTALKTGTPGTTRYDVTLENLVFDTDVVAGGITALLDLRGVSRLLVDRCRLRTNGNDGIWFGTTPTTGDSSIQNIISATQINMEILGSGIGIFVDDDSMTTLTIRDNIFNEGDSQIVLGNSGGSSASTLIDHNTFQDGVTSIEVPTAGVKNLSITNNYAELYSGAFVKSLSPFTESNNRISSGGTLIYDINSYIPNIRMSNPDEFTGGATVPIPNFPAANNAINSDMSIWGDDNGSDQIPFGYTAGALADIVFSKESTIKLVGETSLKIVTAAVNKDIIQRVSKESELAGLRGRRVYLCAWVYTSDASAVRLQISDGVGSANSVNPLYHPGDGEWQYLVATKIIDSSATVVDFKVRNSIAVATYYIDSFTWSVDEPVSLYAVPSSKDAGYNLIDTVTSIDLSGAADTRYNLYNNTGNGIYINKATLLYTEASSADAGIALKIGKETDDDYFFTGTSEASKSQYYALDLTLLKNIIGDGDTVVFSSAGGKTGTGEVKLIIEYLSN